MKLTQAQRILFEVMNKGAIANNSDPIDEQSFIDILSDKENKAHAFAMAQLEAMEVYGEAKNKLLTEENERLRNFAKDISQMQPQTEVSKIKCFKLAQKAAIQILEKE
jgi:hypothetical protein